MGICEQDRLETLCDITLHQTSDLALGGHLRPFVHCWLGAQLLFFHSEWPDLGLGIIDRLRRCVVCAEFADSRPGAVDTWLRDRGVLVAAHFKERNILSVFAETSHV